MSIFKLAAAGAVLGLTACVSVPTGPSLHALPGSRKTFEQFQADDINCRNYAYAQVGGRSASDRAGEAATATAITGAAIGAAAGGLIGGGGRGAGVGAGVGLLAGSAVGADEARGSYRGTQRQYDGAYYQCMYAAGHKVPVYGNYAQSARSARAVPQRTPRSSVPPPPDAPPPRIEPPANLPPEHIPPPDAPPPK